MWRLRFVMVEAWRIDNMEDKLREIEECQESNGVNSCDRCSDYWLCLLRTNYVKEKRKADENL